jgi:hypothetical protein
MDPRTVADVAHLLDELALARLGQERFQLRIEVEVVLDGALAPPGDDQDVVDPAGHRLLDDELQDGGVHDREHLLGHGFRRR